MLSLFSGTEKPPNSQSRTRTLPALQNPSTDIVKTPTGTTIVNGLHFSFMAPAPPTPELLMHNEPLTNTLVTEPTRSHQRNEAEQARVNTNLPPFISQLSFQASEKAADLPQFRSTPQSNSLETISQPAPHSPSTRLKRSTISLFTNEKNTPGKEEDKFGRLADWFKGESEPISIGFLPSSMKEKDNSLETPGASSQIRPSSLLQRKSTAQGASKPAMASRFSFFSSRSSLAKSTAQATDHNDEFIDMNVNNALFPAGPADPFSPAAFKNLQQQAEGLLSRLQTAYRERTLQVREIAAEKEALVEETEGAKTRACHLKMQLDDMSVKLAEQDKAMMNLVDELAQEKLTRREEEEARKRSIRLVEHASPQHTSHRRVSRATTASDSGFESEDESPAESLFSRRNGAQSPTMSMSSVSTTNSPDVPQSSDLQLPTSTSQAARLRVPANYAIRTMPTLYRHDIPEQPTPSSCPNCQGVRASEVWGVMGLLKEENRCLKHRVGELEDALDGCLDVVTSVS